MKYVTSDNMSQELYTFNKVCLYSYRDVFIYMYLNSSCIAVVSVFCLSPQVKAAKLWFIGWHRTGDKFCLTLQHWRIQCFNNFDFSVNFKHGEIPQKIPDFCFTSLTRKYSSIGSIFLNGILYYLLFSSYFNSFTCI